MNTATLEKEDAQEQTENLSVILRRFEAAKKRRSEWENLWEECYEFALPQRGGFTFENATGRPRTEQIFDATAMDAVDQLASSMLGNLTPTWSQWFGLKPGPDLSDAEAEQLAPVLEKAAKTIQDHFDRSNFAVEIHQCYLDLIVGGTASLFFEETAPGAFSAFKFSAAPLTNIVLEEGEGGYLDGAYRQMNMTLEQLQARFPLAVLPADILKRADQNPQERFKVLEAVVPDGLVYAYHACLVEDGDVLSLSAGQFEQSPVISFRWVKSPGEVYGRSPVMKALPDIKTANKVVELILKNASIAVTGIWQADDDGVLGAEVRRRRTAGQAVIPAHQAAR